MKFLSTRSVSFFLIVLLISTLGLLACSDQEQSALKHLESAKSYIAQQKFNEAEIELRNVIQKNPQNEEAYIQLSQVYQRLGKPEKELQAILQAISINPDNMESQLKLGRIFILGQQTKKARETAQLMLKKEPNNINGYHLLASAQVRERNIDSAINTLQKALKIEPDNPHLHLFLGFLYYYDKKDFKLAEASYLKALSIDETIRETYEELITIYINEKLFDKAEALSIKMAEKQGDRRQNLSQLGRFYESRNQLKKAEQTYLTIVQEAEKGDYTAVYNLAVFYARTQQFDSAVQQFKNILMTNDTPKIRMDLANVYFELDNYKEAANMANIVIKKEPNNASARLLLSKLFMVKEKYARALENLEQLIAIDKENGEAYFLKAICLVEEDLGELPAQKIRMAATGSISERLWKRDLAIKSLKTTISLSQDHFMARTMLADLYIKNNNYTQADKQLKYVLEHAPENLQALFMYGNLKILQEKWKEALSIFSAITASVPDFSIAHIKLGMVYNSINNPQKAIEQFNTALKADPLNMNALRLIINMYMSQGKKQTALNILSTHKTNAKLTPKERAYIIFLNGKIALSDNNPKLAKKLFNESVKLYGETTPSYEALARLAEIEGNQFSAIKYYELILSYAPRYIPAHINLSRIYQSNDEIEKAKISLGKVLEIKDNHTMAANSLAYILAEQGKQLQRALHLARVAESQDPNNPGILDTLGWVYYKQKAYDLSIHKLEASIKINPNNPYSHYHLGWAYYDTGRYEKSREHMATALKLDPNFIGAKKARQIIGQ